MDIGMRNIILFKPYLPNQNMEFLYYILKLAESNIRNYTKSINKSYFGVNFIKEYLIPIPPVEEQERIVKLLKNYEKKFKNNNLNNNLKKIIM